MCVRLIIIRETNANNTAEAVWGGEMRGVRGVMKTEEKVGEELILLLLLNKKSNQMF